MKSTKIIKELVNVQREAIESGMHLGSLLNTQEARVALGYHDSYPLFVLGNLHPPPVRLQFLKYIIPNFNPFPMTGVILISIRINFT